MEVDADADFDARLERDGVGFTADDARLLRAVRRHGSLNAAADALGRSYSRSQRRVVELEDAFGGLLDRERGGSGGGGSSLTENALDLLRALDRLRAGFTGVAEVDETVLEGRVVGSNGELRTVDTDAGTVRAVVPSDAAVAEGDRVRLAVRADAVTVHSPGGVPDSETSARNRFEGTVSGVETGDAVVRLHVDVGSDTDLAVLVTAGSAERLSLEAGADVVVSFKATATRGYPVEG